MTYIERNSGFDESREPAVRPRLCVIMTVFNRIDLTKKSLSLLFTQVGLGKKFDLDVIVVDDGSTDSTASIIESEFGNSVRLLQSTEPLFWSRGMALAQRAAVSNDPSFLVWMNNDIELDSDAIIRLLTDHDRCDKDSIIIGAMYSELTQRTSYSGFKKISSRPGDLRMITPSSSPQNVDTLNGNLVLIPRRIYKALGTVDEKFSHAYGDLDYGLRAKAAGYDVVLGSGHFGRCDRNPFAGTWEDSSLPPLDRVKMLFSRKGLPLSSHIYFVRKYSPRLWAAYVIITYLRRLGRIACRR